jgi:hypothetical protein
MRQRSLYLLVTGFALLLPVSLVQTQNATDGTPDFKTFVGTWKTEFKGQPFIVLHLREKEQKLIGSCTHSRSINWGRDGDLTIVSDEMTDDKVLDARLADTKLVVTIANSESPEDVVTIELKLTGKDQAEGRLLKLPPDVPKQKPWLFKRS